MNTNHSPLPWTNNVDTIWRGSKPIVILPVNDPVSIADAEYIVQACNAYPALVEALEDAADDFTDIRMILQSPVAGSANERLAAIEKLVNRSRDKRQAALALARGEEKGESK